MTQRLPERRWTANCAPSRPGRTWPENLVLRTPSAWRCPTCTFVETRTATGRVRIALAVPGLVVRRAWYCVVTAGGGIGRAKPPAAFVTTGAPIGVRPPV